MSWPKIVRREATEISPWVTLIARAIEFSPNAKPEVYHSVGTFDYVIVFAVAPDGRVPLVRQYRPAVEAFTWEFPAGIIDRDEEASDTAKRELLEETGFPAKAVHALGISKTDAGRLGNHVHSYFVEAGVQLSDFKPEDGMRLHLVTLSELVDMIINGEFDAQANLGTLLLAVIRGHIKFP